ncbi:periplasmic heavy metal sensor [Marinicauda sp. Alg238-R41]|uniref:periplasmic heavy metal sensor n=1 Tax=Marinicauda sp. Alg238-R41 TaxID=2993447 RepID=UPI0022DF52BC|nr:periplasmic heavy metal sensor [Marinicauda sp. Alg238-R41]
MFNRTGLAANLWVGLLVVSVLANGILIGVLLQRGFEQPGAREDRALETVLGPGRFNPRAFYEALPEEGRAAARERMMEGRGEIRPLLREAGAARREAAAAILAEPFDTERAAEALRRARETRAAVEAQGERVLLDIVEGLDPQTRSEVLAEAYSGRPPFEGRHHRRHDRRDRHEHREHNRGGDGDGDDAVRGDEAADAPAGPNN